LPLLYLPTAVMSELSPEAVKKRAFSAVEVSLSEEERSGTRTGESVAKEPQVRHTDPKLPEDTSLVRLVLHAERYNGRRVTTMGKVCKDGKLPADSFFCYQLLMMCCAADARPVGVLVEYHRTKVLHTGEWVKIEGTVGSTTLNDHHVLKVAAERVEPTEPPKNQYLWP
jgi:putative membrane protein